MYARRVESQVLTFDLSPALERGVLIMRDRETGTLWSQLTGKGISGRLTGQQLTLLNTNILPWRDWRRRHSATSLYAADPNGLFRFLGSEFLVGAGAAQHGQFVLGTRLGSAVRAYPLDALDRSPILNDELGGVPIVVAYDGRAGFGVVWDRKTATRVLRFQSGPGPLQAVDDEGNTWDLLRGEARTGPLAGEHLNGRWTTLAYRRGRHTFFGTGSFSGE